THTYQAPSHSVSTRAKPLPAGRSGHGPAPAPRSTAGRAATSTTRRDSANNAIGRSHGFSPARTSLGARAVRVGTRSAAMTARSTQPGLDPPNRVSSRDDFDGGAHGRHRLKSGDVLVAHPDAPVAHVAADQLGMVGAVDGDLS